MATTYDTVELRRVAALIRESSEEVSKTIRSTTRWMQDDIPEHLSGDTADALVETVDEIHEQLSSLSKETDDIGLQLKLYASALEQADRRIAAMIQSQ